MAKISANIWTKKVILTYVAVICLTVMYIYNTLATSLGDYRDEFSLPLVLIAAMTLLQFKYKKFALVALILVPLISFWGWLYYNVSGLVCIDSIVNCTISIDYAVNALILFTCVSVLVIFARNYKVI